MSYPLSSRCYYDLNIFSLFFVATFLSILSNLLIFFSISSSKDLFLTFLILMILSNNSFLHFIFLFWEIISMSTHCVSSIFQIRFYLLLILLIHLRMFVLSWFTDKLLIVEHCQILTDWMFFFSSYLKIVHVLLLTYFIQLIKTVIFHQIVAFYVLLVDLDWYVS